MRWRRAVVRATPLLVLLAALGPAAVPGAELVESIVAEVDGVPITRRDLEEALLLDEQWLRLGGEAGLPARELRERIERRVLGELIDHRLLLQQAERLGLQLAPEEQAEVERLFEERVKADWGSVEALRTYLEERRLGLQRLRARYREQFLIRKLLQREMAFSDDFVRPAEIRRYYELQSASYQLPGRVVFRYIQISKARHGEETARRLAESIAAALRAGADWGALCREHSDGARAEEGGRMEVRAEDDIGLPALREAVARLEPGQTSEVIETESALFIVRLEQRQPAGRRPFAQVQQEIQERLLQERREQLIRQLKARLRAQATIRIRLP
ncbi:MAG: hypothetical protein KatS3mg102_1049 [Planctomycetota bacterium]|nr:MAG: hypothetical protein KatS3mg102_1049 [Planctomycetota bacterium]